jgi:hypothetical protein
MNLRAAAEKLSAGQAVEGRPHGNSMRPIIRSGDLVRVEPVTDDTVFAVGQVVLAKVGGRLWLHKIGRIGQDGRFLITNMKGHPNGWSSKIYGKVTQVNGEPLRT